ncbi:MAG TPA: glycosyltransferase [Acidimicrobiia bacterium]
MHVCLVAPNNALEDPRARVMRFVLERAGHRVTTVLPGRGPSTDSVIQVATPPPPKKGLFRRRPDEDARTRLFRAIADRAASTGATLFLPTDPRALEAAIEAARHNGVAVLRTPKMDRAGDVDLVDLAPLQPELAEPPAGSGIHHTPSWNPTPYEPRPGAHAGKKVVLCYRKSEINPGRYLEEALRKAGVDLRVETDAIDLDTVPADTDVVVFVEAPYPALEVTGSTDVPTLFWFHHGEHHLHANLRLADRYRADAVLMAHSWHLAPFAHLPVHRFPFGMASDLLRPEKRLNERTYDVAMVGAKLFGGGPYGRRQQMVAELSAAFPPERLGFRENVLATEMAELYADSRIVINEGGTRHYPITMRVFETVGSGAVLLSDRLPGMEVLLDEGTQYAVLGDDVVGDCQRLLSDMDVMQRIADSALERARGLHTYAHRVDELFAIAATTTKREIAEPREPTSPLAVAIDRDVEVQRIAFLDAPDLIDELPDREVMDATTLAEHRLAPAKMETVAIRADDVSDLRDLMRAARRYIYVEGAARGLDDYLHAEQPQAEVTTVGDVIRVDLMAPSYRIMPFEEQAR